MVPARIASVLLLAAAFPAGAAMLYKSVSPSGVIEFSDQPPATGAKLVEQRDLGAAISNLPGSPTPVQTAPRIAAIESLENDSEVSNAASQVDLAEHALALARRGIWAPMEGLRLRHIARTNSDEERIEFYKRGVKLARQNLVEVMKRRATVLAAPGMPVVTTVASR